jgi:hypothetical protein
VWKEVQEDIREELEVSYNAVSREQKKLGREIESDPKLKNIFRLFC